jgi:hypothetical protein
VLSALIVSGIAWHEAYEFHRAFNHRRFFLEQCLAERNVHDAVSGASGFAIAKQMLGSLWLQLNGHKYTMCRFYRLKVLEPSRRVGIGNAH